MADMTDKKTEDITMTGSPEGTSMADRPEGITMADRPDGISMVDRPEDQKPQLDNSFWADLLNLPSCKSVGVCDDCGRCER